MTLEIAVTYAVLLLALLAVMREWLPADLVLLSALGVLIAIGVVELEEALLGFADPTILALGALFVVAAGLRQTGVLRKAGHLLLGDGRGEAKALARLTTAAASSSAFLNNTPIVAMGIPAVLSWARDRGVSPSRFLIPLSYASILGGVCTLIGTSTNLVADGMLRARGLEGLGFFELGAVGLPLTIAGIAYLVLVAPRILPARATLDTEVGRGTVAEDIHLVRIPGDSDTAGRKISEARLGTSDLQLMRMVRGDGTVVRTDSDAVLRAGDRLTFRGDSGEMVETIDRLGLESIALENLPDLAEGADLREAVVAEGSELVGDKVGGSAFADRYDAILLGVVRDGKEIRVLDGLRFHAGDVLLMVARPEFERNYADSHHLHLLSGEGVATEPPASLPIWAPTRAKIGAVILGGVVGAATSGIVHISIAALGGAILMIVLGLVTPPEARRSVDWSVLIVIGSAIGLGRALEASGGAEILAEQIAAVGSGFGPRGVLASLLFATMLFTLTITNNAAVAIVIPVAVAVGEAQGLGVRPLVIGVTIGASLAFATPLGYQTNLMVYGPGGYSFGDFLRAGLPLQVILGALSVLLVPWIWPR